MKSMKSVKSLADNARSFTTHVAERAEEFCVLEVVRAIA